MDPKNWCLVGFIAGVLFTLGIACLSHMADQMFVLDEDRLQDPEK